MKMKSDCRRIADHLIDIVEGKIPAHQIKAIQDHLASCPRCERLVRDFSRVWQNPYTAGKRIPSERFWPELIAKIEAQERPQPLVEKIIAGLKSSFRPAAASLILALAIYSGYQLGNTPMETTPTEVSYFDPYIEDLQDFPEGSVSDFYALYKIQDQQEEP